MFRRAADFCFAVAMRTSSGWPAAPGLRHRWRLLTQWWEVEQPAQETAELLQLSLAFHLRELVPADLAQPQRDQSLGIPILEDHRRRQRGTRRLNLPPGEHLSFELLLGRVPRNPKQLDFVQRFAGYGAISPVETEKGGTVAGFQ